MTRLRRMHEPLPMVVFCVSLLLSATVLPSQNKAPRPSFEVASVKPVASTVIIPLPSVQQGDRFNAPSTTLERLVAYAYSVRSWQVADGPEWVRSQQWSIEAKASEETMRWASALGQTGIRDTMALMLQTLIEERFKLQLRRETRRLTGFELFVSKGGLKVKKNETQTSASDTSKTLPNLFDQLRPGSYRIGRNSFEGRAIGIEIFINFLQQLLNRPVINKTGVQGLYDMKVIWTAHLTTSAAGQQPQQQVPGDVDASFFSAIQDDLGLRLTLNKVPVETIVIVDVKKPTPN